MAVLKSVIKYGNKHGIFHFEEWEIEYPTQTEKQTAAHIVIKSSAYIDASLAGTAHPQNIGVLLALCTGMRIGEVCALKWEDVDFAQKTIIVKHTVGRIYNCELKSTERVHSSQNQEFLCRDSYIQTTSPSVENGKETISIPIRGRHFHTI